MERKESRSKQRKRYPAETKLAHDPPSTTRLRTPVFDGSGASVPSEGIELELGLIANLGREGLVASYVEVGSPGYFVSGDTFTGFDIAEDSDFCHDFSVWSVRVREGGR